VLEESADFPDLPALDFLVRRSSRSGLNSKLILSWALYRVNLNSDIADLTQLGYFSFKALTLKMMIEDLRKQVDKLDASLIGLVGQRMELSRKIGKEKKQTGQEIHVKTREIAILDKVKLLGDRQGLSDSFVADLYQVILTESRRIQSEA
jgi:chorismate mutase